jgi:hypothetical protein
MIVIDDTKRKWQSNWRRRKYSVRKRVDLAGRGGDVKGVQFS